MMSVSLPAFSPEMLFLFACGTGREERVQQAINENLDWQLVFSLANRHRVVPQVMQELQKLSQGNPLLPEWQPFQQASKGNTLKNLEYGRFLAQIAREFSESGIPLLVLKGPALAIQHYGGIHQRAFRDLDLMIPPEHLLPALEKLFALGFQAEDWVEDLHSTTPKQFKRFQFFNKDMGLKRGRLVLELHWRMDPNREMEFPPDRLWNADSLMEFGGQTFHVLPHEEQVAYLAWHGGQHLYRRLSWLFDFATVVKTSQELNWSRLLELSKEHRLENYLSLGFRCCQDFFQLPLPEQLPVEFARKIPQLDRAMKFVHEEMSSNTPVDEHSPLMRQRWHWMMAPDMKTKLTVFRMFLRPNHDDTLKPFWPATINRIQFYSKRLWRAVSPSRSKSASLSASGKS